MDSLPHRARVRIHLESGRPAKDLGTIANAIFVRRQIEKTFAQRQQVLPKLLSRVT